MPSQITVEELEKGNRSQYRVTVTEGQSRTEHTVTVEKSYRDPLVGQETSSEQLLQRSFEFLLAREPKESILRSFDLRVISRYFPEYEREMRRVCGSAGP
jgi:hypothetical protein